MNSVVFLFLNRVPRPKFEGSLTDLKLSNHGEAKEFTTTKGVFCFLCNLKFRNVLIIVQVWVRFELRAKKVFLLLCSLS